MGKFDDPIRGKLYHVQHTNPENVSGLFLFQDKTMTVTYPGVRITPSDIVMFIDKLSPAGIASRVIFGETIGYILMADFIRAEPR